MSSISYVKMAAELPLYINLQEKDVTLWELPTEHRSNRQPSLSVSVICASSICTSRRSRGSFSGSFSKSEKSHRLSWASFWSAKEHKLSTLKSDNNNESPSFFYQDALSDSKLHRHGGSNEPYSGNKVYPSNPIRDSNVDQIPKKTIVQKFARLLPLLVKKQLPTKSSNLLETTYDASEGEENTEEINSFALHLSREISMDKSELGYLSRMQQEECLQWQKRKLFTKNRNTVTSNVKEVITTPI